MNVGTLGPHQGTSKQRIGHHILKLRRSVFDRVRHMYGKFIYFLPSRASAQDELMTPTTTTFVSSLLRITGSRRSAATPAPWPKRRTETLQDLTSLQLSKAYVLSRISCHYIKQRENHAL